jgi:hypothetical protein
VTDQPAIRTGQIWADNDKRNKGRTLRVDHVTTTLDGEPFKVFCTILTNSDEVQASLDAHPNSYIDRRGKQTAIDVSRMRPTSTGYRLIQDA